MYRNVKDVFIPVFWTENSVSLSDEYTNGVKIMLKIVEFGPFVYYGLFILGCLIILGVILLHVFHYKIPRDEKKRYEKIIIVIRYCQLIVATKKRHERMSLLNHMKCI
ncbi:hypothetical protein Phum_PHUM408250 [Pediculus humanus corporis]|nr:uncharacterized protein Phum_PHUM408250 [Pediculus humanus corporis]EEB16159.1 hypothetical protein Phum_PHUM408250 [Pediculus humanus corporis]